VEIAMITKNQNLAQMGIEGHEGLMLERVKALVTLGKFFKDRSNVEKAIDVMSRGNLQSNSDYHDSESDITTALALIAEASGRQADESIARESAKKCDHAIPWAIIASFSNREDEFGMAIAAANREPVAAMKYLQMVQIANAYVSTGTAENIAKARKIASEIKGTGEVDILVAIAEQAKNEEDIGTARRAISLKILDRANKTYSPFHHRCRLVCLTKDVQALDGLCEDLEDLVFDNGHLDNVHRAWFAVSAAKAITAVYNL
jgi:hypothetical protein